MMHSSLKCFGVVVALLVAFCNKSVAEDSSAAVIETTKSGSESAGWIDLLQPEEFAATWKSTSFGGEGKVEFKDGVLRLGNGDPMTGVTFVKDSMPKDNFEIKWSARRVSGTDFLSCLTFPVAEEFCSVVVGGWGGGLVGLSSINHSDASENETTQFRSFTNGQWYDFVLTVTPEQIIFTIDGEEMIDVPRADRSFSTRLEVTRCKPLGICTYQSTGEIKDLKLRSLDAKAVQVVEDAAEKQTVKPKFMQIKKNDKDQLEALQTAVASYKITGGPFDGATIDLVGAVHVGSSEYYQELNRRFATYDAVLFELVADPEIRLAGRKDREGVINPVSSMQVAMKDALELQFQLDEIDYDAKNFVHADMTPDEFLKDMEKRKDSFVSMFARVIGSSIAMQSTGGGGQEAAMLAAMMQPNRAVALRRVFAQQLDTAEMQMAGLADSKGLSTLVTERNNKTMSVLRSELKSGKRKLAIFFGAAHLDDMHLKLERDFDAKLSQTTWVTAWDLRNN